MGDSDDEHDRRRGRDKFRGERNDYENVNRRPPHQNHRGGYDRGGRGPPPDRRGGGHRDFHRPQKRDYYNNSRDREMPGRGASPPMKRARDNSFGNADNNQQWPRGQDPSTPSNESPAPAAVTPGGAAPSLPNVMSFKEFIMKQEDDIEVDDAIDRYQEYKLEFKKTQINDFFVLHKDEEWFKEKYHPKDSITRSTEVRLSLRKRCRVFVDLLDGGYIDRVTLQIDNCEEVLKFLDRFLIKLEGGSDKAVEELDTLELNNDSKTETEQKDAPMNEDQIKSPAKEEAVAENANEKPADTKADPDYKYEVDEGVGSGDEGDPPGPPGADDDIKPPGMEGEEKEKEVKEDQDDDEEDVNVNILHRGSLSFLFTDNSEDKSAEAEKPDTSLKSDEGAVEDGAGSKGGYDGSNISRPLSLFMRSLPPTITRADLTEVCKRYPGFLRVSMGDPLPDRRFHRLGWATFEHTVNIKDICWNLSNIRIKDNDLSPVVNKECVNRVRPVAGLTTSDMAMQFDLKLAIEVIKRLDTKHKLYIKDETNGSVEVSAENTEATEEAKQETPVEEKVDLPAENPVLASLPENVDKLVDCDVINEADGTEERSVDHNETLQKMLDKVLLYLRIVHSIDYYNGSNYSSEDEMPARCGVIHVRDTTPNTVTKQGIIDWHDANKEKIVQLAPVEKTATEEEAKKLGEKEEEIEVDNFVKANTQELAKDKWLCPLSGKKFRGPDFIRKHIFNKHVEAVENVKAEVSYFNNYVYDMRRPCFPEVKPTKSIGTPGSNTSMQTSTPMSGNRNWNQGGQQQQSPMFATPRAPYTPQYNNNQNMGGGGGDGGYGRINTYPPKPIRRDQGRRPVIKYRDLDAPDEGDFF